MTQEECDEMKKFYKPFLDKYESKYRIHYQMLQQMSRQVDLADPPMNKHLILLLVWLHWLMLKP